MKLRVFVFDAEPTVRLFLSECLKRRGYEVFAFPHGFNCSVCDGTVCADVIITDAVLSHGSGIEFLEKQREVGCRNKHMAVMAGSWSREENEKARQLGFRTFTKPFTHTELNEWLDEVEQDIAPGRALGTSFLANSPIAADRSLETGDSKEK